VAEKYTVSQVWLAQKWKLPNGSCARAGGVKSALTVETSTGVARAEHDGHDARAWTSGSGQQPSLTATVWPLRCGPGVATFERALSSLRLT